MDDQRVASRRPEIAGPLSAGTAAVAAVGETMQRKPDRSEVWKITTVAAATAAAVAVLVSVPLALSGARDQARQELAQEARNQALEQAQAASAQRADAAFQAAQKANAELARRGQPQVPVPPPSDDHGAQEGTLVAAAVAGTLAALPEQVRAPSAQDLGAAVASYMVANPAPGPTTAQIAEAVAAFVRANPPAAGRDGAAGLQGPTGVAGPTGERGPGPTPEQIQDAVTAWMASNPDSECRSKGGQWRQLNDVVQDPTPNDVVGTDATTVTIWACVPE